MEFEHFFIEKVLELVAQQNIYTTKMALAKAIWPEMPKRGANTTLNDVINQNSKGKKRNLRLHEAVRMAEIVNKSFPSLCFEVAETLKLRESVDSLPDNQNISSEVSQKKTKSIPKSTYHTDSTNLTQTESR